MRFSISTGAAHSVRAKRRTPSRGNYGSVKMAVQEKLYTADDLWDISHQDDEKRYELDEGVLVEMSPSGDTHGELAIWLGHLILVHVDTNDLGVVSAAETGYKLSSNPDIVRAPDVGFIAKVRITPLTGKYYPIAPDLAIEIVSPNDTATQIRRK